MALISTTGPVCPNVVDTPLDNRSRVSRIAGIGNIPLAWKGMLVYCEENGKTYKVTSLKPKRSGPVEIENYYPATWVEFGSGGSTPSPTPSAIDAGDVTYSSSGTFSNGTVGKELQSLTSIIGTLTNLKTAYKNDLVGAINEIFDQGGGSGDAAWGSITGTIADQTDLIGISSLTNYYTKTNTYSKSEVDALIPSVPITSIAKKTNTNPISPNQGRVNLDLTAEDIAYDANKSVKGKLNNIDNLIENLTPDPNKSSSTIIDLYLYSEWEDDESEYHSFIYNSSANYVYETSSTSQIKVTSNSTPHAVFKVSDRDIYIDYIISTSGNDTIYTANYIYNSSNLPSEFKEQFELGVYALIYRIIGQSGDSIPYGKIIIADTDNKILNVVYRDVVDGGVTKHQLIARAFDKNRIYIYETPDATYTKGYKFKVSYSTSDSGFSDLNKLFTNKASDIDYSNTNSGLSAINVNTAIDEVFTTLKHTPGSATVSSGSFTLPGTVTGNTYYDITSTPITSLTISSINSPYEVVIKFTTDSTNTCTVIIPNNQKYIGDFSVGKGVTYIMSIFNGVIVIAETKTNSQTE